MSVKFRFLQIFGWYYGRNDDLINSFWIELTFSFPYYAGAVAGCTVLSRVSCNQVMCENSSDTSHQFFSSTYTNR